MWHCKEGNKTPGVCFSLFACLLFFFFFIRDRTSVSQRKEEKEASGVRGQAGPLMCTARQGGPFIMAQGLSALRNQQDKFLQSGHQFSRSGWRHLVSRYRFTLLTYLRSQTWVKCPPSIPSSSSKSKFNVLQRFPLLWDPGLTPPPACLLTGFRRKPYTFHIPNT